MSRRPTAGGQTSAAMATRPRPPPVPASLCKCCRPTGTSYRIVLMKSSNSSWGDGYGLGQYGTGNISFFINNYAGHVVSSTIPAGQYSHVVGTYDGATIRLYVNGELTSSTSYVAAI